MPWWGWLIVGGMGAAAVTFFACVVWFAHVLMKGFEDF